MIPLVLIATGLRSAVFCGDNIGAPKITADAAIAVDAQTGQILWGKNIDMPLYPASTTKLLTALILVQETKPTDFIVAPADVEKVRGSSLHMVPGEKINARDALYALMLRSANDTAHSIAVTLAGSDEKFAEIMNATGREIGMKRSHWVTPHGLNNPWHKTTAYDLSRLAIAVAQQPAILEAARLKEVQIERDKNKQDVLVQNHNRILKKDPTNLGLKTGYTDPAGLCFVGLNEGPFGRLVTVVLNSRDYVSDQMVISTWAKTTFERRDDLLADQQFEVPLKGGKSPEVAACLPTPIAALAPKSCFNDPAVSVQAFDVEAPVKAGQQIGKVMVTVGSQVFESPLIATQSIDRRFQLRDLISSPVAIFMVLAASCVYWFRNRTYRKLHR